MTESQLKEGFADLVEPVVPEPDAYGRLMRRDRRRRRTRTAGWSAVLAAILAVPIALQGAGGGLEPSPPPEKDPITSWVQRFLDEPAVGLPADASLTAAVTGFTSPEFPEVKVVYVDEVPGAQVAFAILHSATTAVGRWVSVGGARPWSEATSVPVTFSQDTPYAATRIETKFARFTAMVAPSGCNVDTAPLAGRAWHSLDRTYVARAYANANERWRVICDGTGYFDGPAWHAAASGTPPFSGDLNVAMIGTRGIPNRDLAWIAMLNFDQMGEGFAWEPPVIRYSDEHIAIAVAPVAKNAWKVVWYYKDGAFTEIHGFSVADNLRDPDAPIVIGLRLDPPPGASPSAAPANRPAENALFVVGPAGAARVAVDEQYQRLTAGAGRIEVPRPAWSATEIEFQNAAGQSLGHTPVKHFDPMAQAAG